ncbi:50S ribosomal protein L4 [Legionella sp. W05-934-2]|jgi:large subunit ribosomal protein L4|uniref:50S ribosomal protein L4 n=1 Tax=Legionella sp. W05-934-2 TaxID=1198649 RepID=UPI0034632999
MQVQTVDTNKKVSLDTTIFDVKFNEGLVHQTVCKYLANSRSGNSAQKNRSEVSGGGKKPWRQKGSGRARAGTIRSPLWRSGGVTFASKKRDYSQKLPKKMYRAAMRSLLAELNRNGALKIVSDFQVESPKTRAFIQKINELQLTNALIVMADLGENEYLASRNLIDFLVIDVQGVDPVVLLKYDNVVITEEALKKIEEKLQ